LVWSKLEHKLPATLRKPSVLPIRYIRLQIRREKDPACFSGACASDDVSAAGCRKIALKNNGNIVRFAISYDRPADGKHESDGVSAKGFSLWRRLFPF
jgi:hypothetical protein